MREDFGKFTMVLHNPSSVLRDDKIKTGGDVHPLQNQHREPSAAAERGYSGQMGTVPLLGKSEEGTRASSAGSFSIKGRVPGGTMTGFRVM